MRGPVGADADRIRHAFGAVRMTAARVYWHTARVTKISVGHSASFGARPLSRTCAGHLCSDWVSRLLPVWNPLPRQAAAAAAWQSGAPFCATAQRSRTITMRAFGNPTTASVASLAASRVSLPSCSNVACAPCKSDLNRVVPSLSQWPIVSTKPGRKTESGAGAAGGVAAGSPGCWLGISPGGRTSCAGADAARQSAPATSTARAMDAKERASGVSEWLVISIPSTSQPRAGWAGHVAKMRSGGTSEQIEGGNDAGDQHHRSHRCPEAQPFFDDRARLRAVAAEQERLDIKSHAARDDRQQHEQEQIVAGEARCNGHDLVGDRGEPLEQDDPAAPLHVSRTKRVDLVAVAVELDQPEPDRIVEHGADEIAEHAAGHRRHGAHGRVEPGPVRPRERHRN